MRLIAIDCFLGGNIIMKSFAITRYAIISVTILMLLTGCSVNISSEKTSRTESLSASIPFGEASSVDTKIQIGVGEFKLTGGSEELFSGEFLYNIPEWEPEVEYRDSSDRGKLSISQPKTSKIHTGKTVYDWTLELSNELPTSLDIDLGVGSANIDLKGMNLTDLDLDCGVGEVLLDLSGHWEQSLRAKISSGVGEVTIYLPEAIGAKVNATSGIGTVNSKSLTKKLVHTTMMQLKTRMF